MAEVIHVKTAVGNILEKNPQSRNDDMHLIMMFYHTHYGTADIQKLCNMKSWGKKVVPPESIRRARQMWQAEDKYLSDKQVAEARAKLAEEYRVAKGLPE